MNAVSVGVLAAIVVPVTLLADPHGARALEVIGLGTAVGHWLGVIAGTVLLARRVHAWRVSEDLRSGAASLARAAIMGVVVIGLVAWLDAPAEVVTVVGLAAGIAVYVLLTLRGGRFTRTVRWLRG
jgi:hypothetical protein